MCAPQVSLHSKYFPREEDDDSESPGALKSYNAPSDIDALDNNDDNDKNYGSLPNLVARHDESLSNDKSNYTPCETEEEGKVLEDFFNEKYDSKLPSDLLGKDITTGQVKETAKEGSSTIH